MAISISPGGSAGTIPTGSGYTPGIYGGVPTGLVGGAPLQSISQNQTQSAGQNTAATTTRSSSQSYIPDYSQTPILNEIAQYSRGMAPQIYQWGMDQFNKNQGNIDTMMRNALSYASPQRVAQEMGMAEAGVMQGAEAGRQNAIKDLQSYGIDPSSGRYASLDQASRVMAGASAAGAGNQQRMATEAQGNAMQNQAISASMQNVNTGYGAANAANQFLSTGMQLKYPPLGTTSTGSTDSYSQGTTGSEGSGYTLSGGGGGSGSSAGTGMPLVQYKGFIGGVARGGPIPQLGYAQGGAPGDDATTGGFVSQDLSPSAGAQTDDVSANLNAGEFVIPKDVSAWLGQEYFYKLMAKARAARATAGSETGADGSRQNGGNGGQSNGMSTGYQAGGEVDSNSPSPMPDNVSRWLKLPEGANPADYLPGTGIPRGSFSKGFEQQYDSDYGGGTRPKTDREFREASDAKYGPRSQDQWDRFFNQEWPARQEEMRIPYDTSRIAPDSQSELPAGQARQPSNTGGITSTIEDPYYGNKTYTYPNAPIGYYWIKNAAGGGRSLVPDNGGIWN